MGTGGEVIRGGANSVRRIAYLSFAVKGMRDADERHVAFAREHLRLRVLTHRGFGQRPG
jgi:hypothetical protein